MPDVQITEPKIYLNDNRRKNWFWDYNDVFSSDLSDKAKLVRLFLARCANGDRQSWPSLNYIAKCCGISKPTVIKAINELEEKGWIQKTIRIRPNQEHESTVYALLDPPKTDDGSKTVLPPVKTEPEEEGGGKATLPPVKKQTGLEMGGSKTALLPVKNITENPPETGGGVVKQLYHVVKPFDDVVKPVDSNNTQITIPIYDRWIDRYNMSHQNCAEIAQDKNPEADKNDPEQVIIDQFCAETGATPEQVFEAIRRTNQQQKQGNIKHSYFGLLKAVINTVMQEEAVIAKLTPEKTDMPQDIPAYINKPEEIRKDNNPVNNTYTQEFEEFYAEYPRKIEKRKAFKAFQARLKEGVNPGDLILAAQNYREYCLTHGTEPKYIKHPATFLGPNKPYEDWINPAVETQLNVPKAWHTIKRYLEEEHSCEENHSDDWLEKALKTAGDNVPKAWHVLRKYLQEEEGCSID
ncbi:helix-turn-helix domain-containing protein [Desulforamulus putei]|uniref:helix-turn-helix domain-containing protein n=1 Tax=Desulforamulus putei TaxID=74701 RepID=UPI002FDE4865